ncbi:sulfite exporter TauE/SafE family protein [Aestuariivirga sp.]|uniref:sulfite exporter TauE/SafE family protein n=1 Tax=Aestuariivirga sp. TaxID=2650926 RepID=UPI003BABA942
MPDLTHLAFASGLVFLAAIVRGYSGFGFSLLAITSLSLIFPPARIIPAIFLLEIAASLHLLPAIWGHVHWRSIGFLAAGTLLGTPLGVYALANVPPAPMTLALALFVLLATGLLWRGFALARMPNAPATVAVGAAAGLANGAFGIGGPPVILFYFASPAGHAAGRASLIAYFLLTDLAGLGFLAREGLVTRESGLFAAAFLPALAAGVWLGARIFRTANPARFRQIVLAILAILALLTAGKAVLAF